MSEELIALLRDRVASRFYEQPQVIDAIARRLRRDAGERGENLR